MVRQCMNPRQRSKRESVSPLGLLAGGLLCCCAHDCDAIDRVTLQVGQLSTAGVQAQNAIVTLDVGSGHDPDAPTLDARVAQLRLIGQGTTYSDLLVHCAELVVAEPHYGCGQGNLAARGGPLGQISMTAAGSYDASTGAVSVSGSGQKVAGAV